MWTEWSTAKSQEPKGSQWLPKFNKASAALTFFLPLRRNSPLCPSQKESAGSDIPQTRYLKIKHLLLDFQQIEVYSFSILSLWAFCCPEPPAHNTFSETQDWECADFYSTLPAPTMRNPSILFCFIYFLLSLHCFICLAVQETKLTPLVRAGSCITATCPSRGHLSATHHFCAHLQYLSRDCSYPWPPAQNL